MNRFVYSFSIFILSMLTSGIALARPYYGDIYTFTQPDNTPFEVRLYGDEFYAVIEDLNGYTLTRDPKTGFYCYALAAPDGMSFISSGYKPGENFLSYPGLKKNIRLSPRALKQKCLTARRKFGVDAKGQLLPSLRMRMRPRDFGYDHWYEGLESEAQRLEAAPNAISPGPPSSTTTGTRVGLVLLAQFPDKPGDATIYQSEIDAYVNQPDYTGFNNATSIYGYYNIQSNGTLRYNCIVTAYFTAANPRDYYTDNTIAYGTRAKELINEGLGVLKTKGFDFTKADANGDSVLDGVNLFYAGQRVNGWSEGLWPHKWSSSWTGLSGEGVSTSFQYQITDMGTSLSLGTFCHENGHMLCNFPDLYAYDGNAAEIGRYSLMCQSGTTHPVSVDAYLKIHAGWSTVKDITADDHLRGTLQVDKNAFYRYKNPDNPKEYFILSMRTNTGYEGIYGGSFSEINPTNGLVIFHALEDGSNTYSSIISADSLNVDYTTPYELMVVEANPASATTPWYDDPNPGTNDAYHSGDISEASDTTSPALKFWNTKEGRTTVSGLHVHSVGPKGSTITFVVGSGLLDQDPAIGLTTYSLTPSCDFGTNAPSQTFTVFNAGAGTLNYTIAENLSWLSLDIESGTATTEADLITISYDTSELADGTYNGTIIVTDGDSANSPQTININLIVNAPPCIITSTLTLENSITAGIPATNSFTIANSGGGTLYYTLSGSSSWIIPDRTSGTVAAEEDEIKVSYDASGLLDGSYSGAITVENAIDRSHSKTINLTLHVSGGGYNIIVRNPEGAETLWQGSGYKITWLTDDKATGEMKIELYKGGVLESTITSGTANDGLYQWNIPDNQAIGTDYRIIITSVDDFSISGESNSNFAIAALPELTDIPYSENFETDLGKWKQAEDDDFDWTRNSGGTPSSLTGPSADQDGNFYIFTEASDPNFPDKSALLENTFDLRNASSPMLSFYYHMYGSIMGNLSIVASVDQTQWTTLFSQTGNQGDSWHMVNADLSQFAGQVVMLRIIGKTSSSWYSDMALDVISINETSKKLSYNTPIFTEGSENTGRISNSITITLAGETFTPNVITGDYITTDNLSLGLTTEFVRDSSTQITLTLAGNAINHRNQDSIFDLKISFADGAFTSGDASGIAGSSKSLMIDYLDAFRLLSVTKTGIGEGKVASEPAGIDCDNDCSETFPTGTTITLTATAIDEFSWFAGWSGSGCSGTGDCVITLNEETSVTAAFDAADRDNDTVPDHIDAFPDDPAYHDDADNDGMPSAWETLHGFNPAIDDAGLDSDGDGLSNLNEFIKGSDPQLVTDGPGIPVLVVPDELATDQALAPTLETGYAITASSETHAKTCWQIAADAEFTIDVFKITSSTFKTRVTIPQGILEAETSYYWRVHYIDTDNLAWRWSAPRSFITLLPLNADPTLTDLPADLTVLEETSTNLDLSPALFSDPDSGENTISLTLSTESGTLSATGDDTVTIKGSNTNTLVLSGTAVAIDTFLNTATNIRYTGAADIAGNDADSITLTANDGGHTGAGGGTEVKLGTINIDINVYYLLSVTKTGVGQGIVTSEPDGIDCGNDCSQKYPEGTTITLSATTSDGFSWFTGWTEGSASGIGNWVINLTGDTEITAGFEAADRDNDGIPDHLDAFPDEPAYNNDGDNDGLPSAWEILNGLDPLIDDAELDSDGDGLSNIQEFIKGTDPQLVTNGPGIAVLVAPDDLATDQALAPTLETSYSITASPETHTKTCWQIAGDAEFTMKIFEITSSTFKTQLTLPQGILDPETTYFWRVQYSDTDDLGWAWPTSKSFATLSAPDTDLNDNGLPDNQEVTPGDYLDLDQDDLDDLTQTNMHCLTLTAGSEQVCVKEINHVSAVENFASRDANAIEEEIDRPSLLPVGLFRFRLRTDEPGATVSVTLFFSEPLPDDSTWYQYDTIGGWHDYSEHTTISEDLKSFILEFVDGGYGDADGIANGIIVNTSGPGSSLTKNSDHFGCFIKAAR